ncbi:two-component system, response regulator YesN [Butyrivibrio sp. Su6]|uniref:response regulator n=1 Tax=Butyrivibrio sp. Su6 TaxID=1520810 RepID=UPI00089E4F29|nr:response regulator [Butyrivibrio sp. Su6]SEF65160.1 two-component system, response regulator YesN [Butyrivibrio sp. Su6]
MQESAIRNVTAILIDDEQSVIDGLKHIIDWDRFNIKLLGTANDGITALKLLLEWQPDFAIVDINLPGISGLEIIKQARENNIKSDFIILSGFGEFSYAQEAIRHGAKAYLLKPVNPDEINNHIGQICLDHAKSSHTPMSKRYTRKLTDDYFNRVISGKFTDLNSINSFLNSLDLDIGLGSSYVYVFQFSNDIAEIDELIGVIDNSLQSVRHVTWQVSPEKVAAVITPSEETPFNLALKCSENLEKHSYTGFTIGIGDTVRELTGIAYSYERALTSLSYKIYDSSNNIFSYENICTVPPTLRLQDIDCLPLVQFIVKRDKDNIKAFCEEFFTSLLYVKMPPPNYVYSMCYALFAQIQKEFSNFIKEDINDIANGPELYKCNTIEAIKKWLSDTFCAMSEFVDAIYGYSDPEANKTPDISSIDDDIIKEAAKYINENISHMIKIEDIARNAHLSPSYFATYFKEKTGANLRDYLLYSKMKHAAMLIRSQKVSINALAESLGYSDYRSFSRAFKNVYGCTPSDFQNR